MKDKIESVHIHMGGNPSKKLIRAITEMVNAVYLSLSDCDGMCDHCPSELKIKCRTKKSNE